MAITEITNYVPVGKGLIIQQYKDSPRILALVQANSEQLQDIEDCVWDLYILRSLQTAFGAQLDGLGQIVGISRMGFSDPVYRLFIYIQIAINNSKGTPDQVIAIMKLITGATNVLYIPYYPAALGLQVNVDLDAYLASLGLSNSAFLALIQQIIPAGVALYYITWYNGPFHAFGFESDPDALGYGDLSDPTVGGGYASLF